MLEDIKERVEEIRRHRKETGIRMIWITQKAIDLARQCSSYYSDVQGKTGTKVTAAEVIQLALEDYMANNCILTDEEREDIIGKEN